MPTSDGSTPSVIRRRLDAVRERIGEACIRAGRPPDEVTIIAVTKTYAVETVRAAMSAGVRDFGENRVQELVAKCADVPGAVQGGDVRWHLIGPLQRNKAKEAVRFADRFHALDSVRLAEILHRRASLAGRTLPCLVQVNISGEATKSGVTPTALPALLDALTPFDNLSITGLMTLAVPVSHERELESVVRPQFRRMRSLLEVSAHQHPGWPLNQLSMGMSGDYEIAVEEGATHIRVGSVLFGPRS